MKTLIPQGLSGAIQGSPNYYSWIQHYVGMQQQWQQQANLQPQRHHLLPLHNQNPKAFYQILRKSSIHSWPLASSIAVAVNVVIDQETMNQLDSHQIAPKTMEKHFLINYSHATQIDLFGFSFKTYVSSLNYFHRIIFILTMLAVSIFVCASHTGSIGLVEENNF